MTRRVWNPSLLLASLFCLAPHTGLASTEIPLSFEDRVRQATTVFSGVVSGIDSASIDPSWYSLRYEFRDVTFVKGGGKGRRVWVDVDVRCQGTDVLDGGVTRCMSWSPHASFARGSRYVVFGRGEAIEDDLVKIDFVWHRDVFPVHVDPMGGRLIAGTHKTEKRFLEEIRRILDPPTPGHVPSRG